MSIVNNTEIQTVIELWERRPRSVCIASSGDVLVIFVSDDVKQTIKSCVIPTLKKYKVFNLMTKVYLFIHPYFSLSIFVRTRTWIFV